MSFKNFSIKQDGDHSKSDIVDKIRESFQGAYHYELYYLKLWNIYYDVENKTVRIQLVYPTLYQDYLRDEDEDMFDDREKKEIREMVEEEEEFTNYLKSKILKYRSYGWDISISEHR